MYICMHMCVNLCIHIYIYRDRHIYIYVHYVPCCLCLLDTIMQLAVFDVVLVPTIRVLVAIARSLAEVDCTSANYVFVPR